MTAQPDGNLKDQFDALHAERVRTWQPDQLKRNIDQRRKLVDAFDPRAIAQVGERLENFILEGSEGQNISLDELVAHGPAVLIFFRFAGCPACNLALPYYDRNLRPELERIGVSLLAVSPHVPERGLDEIRSRHSLRFPVAADRGNILARRLGIAFDRDVVPTGQPSDGWLGELTTTGTAELPQPTVVIVDEAREIRFVDVSPDWLDRTEAPEILAAARAVSPKRAAA